MDIISICVPFIVAILGVAYPILLQVISKIDEKYYSLKITNSFEKELILKVFNGILIFSLIAIIIYILDIPPPKNVVFLYNSAEKIVLLFTIVLIISFILLTNKILVYYSSQKITSYLILKHSKYIQAESNNLSVEQDNFEVLSGLLIYSIKIRDESIAQTIAVFMSIEFDRVREKSNNSPVEFSFFHYLLINKLTTLLATNNYKEFNYLKDKSVGGIWLLGERAGYEISAATYQCLWANLKVAIEYKGGGMIMAFWRNAHYYISYRLDFIREGYVISEKPDEGTSSVKISNQKEVAERKKQRERFLQFTTALGGLLIYTKQYQLIQRCFSYTQSTPPRYDLLPTRMGEVFERYFHFIDPYSSNYPFMGHVYSFPNIEGLNEDGLIKKYICKYIALLFLRQYSLQIYLSYQEPLKTPATGGFSQGKRRKWTENIDYFKTLVKEVYADKQLLNEVGFSFLTNDWFKENEKPHPLEFIDNFKNELEEEFENTELTQEISEEIRNKFLASTKSILEETFNECNSISNKKELQGDIGKGYIRGSSAVFDKSAFADAQGVAYLNHDSILAYEVSINMKNIFFNSFLTHSTDSYLLSSKDIFKAIDKFNIDDSYTLIAFGLNLDHLIDTLKIKGLSKTSYKGIPLQYFENVDYQTVGNTIIIIKKEDLPKLNYLDISEKEKDQLKAVSDEPPLYASIIDLNQNKDLRKEIEIENGEDLSKKVLAYIAFILELQWKKNIKYIALRQYNEYKNEGVPNTLNDIKPIKKA